jgi:hypothetical protein
MGGEEGRVGEVGIPRARMLGRREMGRLRECGGGRKGVEGR